MLAVTKLDGQSIFINEDNIQWIESVPDTVITFLGGGRIIVRDKAEELILKLQQSSESSDAKIKEL